VVAPRGTITTNCNAELEIIVAAVPLKLTVEFNKLPELAFIVTDVPAGPDNGKTDAITGIVHGG
jgi:hypothetical protein